MERLEEAARLNKGNSDFQRQLWAALQGMQMKGRKHAAPLADRADTIGTEAAA